MLSELEKLSLALGEDAYRGLTLSILRGENNWQLARDYGLTIHDVRFLQHDALEMAEGLLRRAGDRPLRAENRAA